MSARYAIIIPACNEAVCLAAVIEEFKATLDSRRFVIAVGVNGSSDHTAEMARERSAIVGETSQRGYGYGCQAAIDALKRNYAPVDAYIFAAADGANCAADVPALVAAFESGHALVLGCRTTVRENWPVMGRSHVLANRALGMWCTLLTGLYFADIGPLRLIERELFEAMQLREWTYGWTIEAQIRAVMLGAKVCEIPVRERSRIAGVQKVSRVSWRHSLRIGLAILAAGWRTRLAAHRSATEQLRVPASAPTEAN